MANKSLGNRAKNRRKREKQMGMIRLDISLHKTTHDMLLELVEESDYDVKSREKSKGINGVLTQLIYEVYRRRDKVDLDRTKQQGFILARKLKKIKRLKDTDVKRARAKKCVASEKPSIYLGPKAKEWSGKTYNQLIEKYRDAFGPEPPSEPKPKVTKKAPTRKKAPIAKKTSKKKVAARAN